MPHTKRSPLFLEEIEFLIDRLRSAMEISNTHLSVSYNDVQRIIVILQNNTTDSGCVVKAKDDEPIFDLRGQDEDAPEAVAAWLHAQYKNQWRDRVFLGKQPAQHLIEKVIDAEDCKREMVSHPGRKRAD